MPPAQGKPPEAQETQLPDVKVKNPEAGLFRTVSDVLRVRGNYPVLILTSRRWQVREA